MKNLSSKFSGYWRPEWALWAFLGTTVFVGSIAGMLLGGSIESLLAVVVTFCRRSINEALAHSPDMRSLFLLVPLGISIVFATLEGVLNVISTRRWMISFPASDDALLNARLFPIIKSCRLEGRVSLVNSARTLVFTHGLFKPRVCLSSEVLNKLEDSELTAVLWHEAYHVNAYDPLKLLLVAFLKRMLFFLPLARDLSNAFVVGKEVAADQQAINAMGTARPLLGALRKLTVPSKHSKPRFTVVSGFELVEARLMALHDPERISLVSRHSLGISIVGLLALIVIIWLPLPGHMASLTECSQAGGSILEHFSL